MRMGSSRGTNGLPDVLQVSPIRACRSIGPGSLGGIVMSSSNRRFRTEGDRQPSSPDLEW